ncbi:MAG: DMT family transporter [Bdellovibrionales bacterium]
MKKFIEPATLHGLLFALTTAIAFGFYPPAARGAYAFGANAVLLIIATVWARALAMLLLCFVGRKNIWPQPYEWRSVLYGGAMQALSITTIYFSLLFIPGPVMIIIVFSHTLMLLGLLVWKKEMALSWYALAFSILAIIGLSFAVGVWETDADISLVGIALAFTGALFVTGRMYVYGNQLKQADPAVVGAQAFLVAGVLSLLLCFYEMPVLPSAEGMDSVYLACLVSALGTCGTFYGIAKLGSFNFSMIMKMEPIFTSLASVWLINEILTGSQYAGMALVLGSLVAYQFFEQRMKR